jgi:hypothetical protein
MYLLIYSGFLDDDDDVLKCRILILSLYISQINFILSPTYLLCVTISRKKIIRVYYSFIGMDDFMFLEQKGEIFQINFFRIIIFVQVEEWEVNCCWFIFYFKE